MLIGRCEQSIGRQILQPVQTIELISGPGLKPVKQVSHSEAKSEGSYPDELGQSDLIENNVPMFLYHYLGEDIILCGPSPQTLPQPCTKHFTC